MRAPHALRRLERGAGWTFASAIRWGRHPGTSKEPPPTVGAPGAQRRGPGRSACGVCVRVCCCVCVCVCAVVRVELFCMENHGESARRHESSPIGRPHWSFVTFRILLGAGRSGHCRALTSAFQMLTLTAGASRGLRWLPGRCSSGWAQLPHSFLYRCDPSAGTAMGSACCGRRCGAHRLGRPCVRQLPTWVLM